MGNSRFACAGYSIEPEELLASRVDGLSFYNIEDLGLSAS